MKIGLDFLTSGDPVLKSVIETYGNPVVQVRDQGFAAMVHIILEQQVSISSAKATYRKMAEYFVDITPEKMLSASDEEFRSLGVSRQKTAYIKDMASRVVSGILDFDSFRGKSVDEVTSELLAIKGVGMWTVEVYLMFCLQSPDIIPFGDIAIRKAFEELYGIHEVEKMDKHAQNWKPHRTLASFILWHHYLAKRNRL
ncbi:DNA-3-methyladenine glycosylase 2 family protein [Flavobacterium sp. MAH-1]|uniref:DNA-3-methyladenine glycosylase II n=1 Tax=Flavobacterium agri TaxID=2743471 RepID=A0A7Y9C7P4_9FLAO|nr:DNA-3-methyladenine glycosylase 2 family protein [Flavobacterium agri]NUY82566.1 DNA-3-methyladenine glycosylase 2 family protein [Flavobacterium agri]NYA72589.1 DNA-3-methyladenine glycosylase 2 family protein [Flavobacterium agri]